MNVLTIIGILAVVVAVYEIVYYIHFKRVLGLYEDITLAIDEIANDMEAAGKGLEEVNSFQLQAFRSVLPYEYGERNLAIWSHRGLVSEELYDVIKMYL